MKNHGLSICHEFPTFSWEIWLSISSSRVHAAQVQAKARHLSDELQDLFQTECAAGCEPLGPREVEKSSSEAFKGERNLSRRMFIGAYISFFYCGIARLASLSFAVQNLLDLLACDM